MKTMIAKVETSGQSDSVKKMTVMKLKALGIKVASARKTENRDLALAAQLAAEEKSTALANSAELSERLDMLEKKLNAAQATFGTVIHSLEGFAEYTGEFKSESDRKKMAANLKEQITSRQVGKTKLDNMVKAKAEHAGILREIEILQTATPKLSVVQKGRLASLHTTAATALELLQAVTTP